MKLEDLQRIGCVVESGAIDYGRETVGTYLNHTVHIHPQFVEMLQSLMTATTAVEAEVAEPAKRRGRPPKSETPPT